MTERASVCPPATDDGDITCLLRQWTGDSVETLDRLYGLVNQRLRQTARRHLRSEPASATVHTTVLVHETYLQLLNSRELRFENRKQFFFLASRIMRHILVERARRRLSQKRGGDLRKAPLEEESTPRTDETSLPLDEMVALDQALTRLEKLDRRQAMIVQLRYFAGLTETETAEAMTLSLRTVQREWRSAKRWLAVALKR